MSVNAMITTLKTLRLYGMAQSIEELAEQAAPAYQQAEPILLKVPCLRVVDAAGSESWMYDSREIIGYLEQRFTEAA